MAMKRNSLPGSEVNAFIEKGGKDVTMEPHLTVFSALESLEQEDNISEIGKKYVFDDNNTEFDA